jgi:predicted porin
MKKLLLGATALTVLSTAGAALAQGAPATTVSTSNFNARIGGFMTAGIGYVDTDELTNAAGTKFGHEAKTEIVNNAEVIFNFSLVADNGITFGAKVEFEAQGTSENADEYVATVRGAFGTVEIGREDGAADRIGRVTGNTAFTSAADETGLLFDYAGSESAAVPPGNGVDSGDTLKITYFTPSFAGFQAGASYVPGADSGSGEREFGQGGTSTVGSNDDDEAAEFGVTYSNTFGGFSVKAGGAYVDFLDDGNRFDNSYTGLLNLGFAGFTAGVTYHSTQFTENGVDDTEVLGLGAGYATGPWSFGLTYAQVLSGRNQTGTSNAYRAAAEDDFGVAFGVDYALAPGVTVGGVLEYADGERLNNQAGLTGSTEANAAGVFMGLSF